jgi:broad specificity phosphatase PhoE
MNDITRLFLIRHGDTIDEETKKVYKGSLDIPLSDKGRDRLRGAAQFLSRFTIDHVYTSSLSRCMESGAIIARPHGLEIRSLSGLNEINFGAWEGLSFEEIAGIYPTEFELWVSDPELHSPPLGEPLRDAQERAVAAIDRITDRHRGENIAVVAHGGTLRTIFCSLLGLKLSSLFRLGLDYGSISIVDIYRDNNVVIELLNFAFYDVNSSP